MRLYFITTNWSSKKNNHIIPEGLQTVSRWLLHGRAIWPKKLSQYIFSYQSILITITITFKSLGTFFSPSESCRNQTANCCFKYFLRSEHDKQHVFEFFTLFQSFFLNKIYNRKNYFLDSACPNKWYCFNHETGLCAWIWVSYLQTACRAGCNI